MTVNKLSEMTGLSREAIWAYKKKGQIQEHVHWVKKGRRIFVDQIGFYKWLEGIEA